MVMMESEENSGWSRAERMRADQKILVVHGGVRDTLSWALTPSARCDAANARRNSAACGSTKHGKTRELATRVLLARSRLVLLRRRSLRRVFLKVSEAVNCEGERACGRAGAEEECRVVSRVQRARVWGKRERARERSARATRVQRCAADLLFDILLFF